jgi:hypothetical protein
MKTILSALVALSVIAGVAGTASAIDAKSFNEQVDRAASQGPQPLAMGPVLAGPSHPSLRHWHEDRYPFLPNGVGASQQFRIGAGAGHDLAG